MTSPSDLEYFFELEKLSRESISAGQSFKLSEEQQIKILKSKLDYEAFKFDFDLTCRFIFFFSYANCEKFSNLHILFLKYLFVLSTFLKNRTSTKLSSRNESFLERAINILIILSRISIDSIYDTFNPLAYDTGQMFINFSIVNIYEILKKSKSSPLQNAAYYFLSNDFKLKDVKRSLLDYSTKIPDFISVGTAFDETVRLNIFQKYNSQEKPKYKNSFESINIFWFCIYLGVSLVGLAILLEILSKKYFK